MRFDLVINLKTAQTLGITILPRVLLQATEVVQVIVQPPCCAGPPSLPPAARGG
jgi:hypothetical protein